LPAGLQEEQIMDVRALRQGAIAATVVALVFLGLFGWQGLGLNPAGALPQAPSEPGVAAAPGLPDFAGIVERFGPAVVNISVTAPARTGVLPFQVPRLDPDDPFYEFFRRFMPERREEVPRRGLGSGFIVSPDGVILTNAHVVAEASEVTVRLTDRREFEARVVGLDRLTDVAVLRIEAKGLPTVKLGNPAESRVGDWVLAIGSPFGFEHSVTAGIVSAKSRSLPREGYVPFIQTDVAVNPGNSGGPLFNLKGEVIGINAQIYSRTGGFQGLSFAIPIDVAVHVKDQILATGKVSRGRLGVSIQEVNQSLADSFGLKRPMGALVTSVEKDSPAERAGIEAGDVILKFDGRDVTRFSDLPLQVAQIRPGTVAKLEIWRGGKTREIAVTVGEWDDTQTARRERPEPEDARLGVVVRPLTPEERRDAGMDAGLLVLEARGAAARAGLRPGDVILRANGTRVASPQQLRSVVSKAGKHVALLIQRGDTRIFVPVELG
jgi:serine protease Do